MTLLFYFLYNLIITIAWPIIWVSAYFNEKLGGSLTGQKRIKSNLSEFTELVKSNPKPVVWLHAASAGEFEQIKPILSRVRKQDVYIFQTFTSATIYYKASQDNRFDGVSFLPWDLYFSVNSFIKNLKPALHINTRHDIWPNLLLALHRNKVRNILVNANLYNDSLRLKPIFRQLNLSVFKYIDHVYTGSESLKSLLSNLYNGEIDVVGDSRFDQVSERASTNNSVLISENVLSDRRVIVYGSTVDSDLPVLSAGIAKSLSTNAFLHVIVPHEIMERDLIPWEVDFYRHNIKTIRLSEIDQYNNESVLIWNHVGQLADLYKYANLAYIGAGFSTGVHSVTEPAIYHVPCAHGPKYDILAEAIELVDSKLSTVIYTAQDLVNFLHLPDERISELEKSVCNYVHSRIGASEKIVNIEFPLTQVHNVSK